MRAVVHQHGLSMNTTHETVKDHEYGKHLPGGKLLRLEDPAFPSSPYGAAKVLQCAVAGCVVCGLLGRPLPPCVPCCVWLAV